jgi:hypothetical protein
MRVKVDPSSFRIVRDFFVLKGGSTHSSLSNSLLYFAPLLLPHIFEIFEIILLRCPHIPQHKCPHIMIRSARSTSSSQEVELLLVFSW